MAIARRRVLVSNPKRKRAVKRKRSTTTARKRKRTASAKAPKVRRYATKTLKAELKRRGASTTPRRSTKRRVTKRKTTRRKTNPVMIELAGINPRKRRSNVARKRKTNRRRKAASTTNRRRRRTVATTNRRRRRSTTANPRRRTRRVSRRRGVSRRRRNPAIFGRSGARNMLVMVGGGLVGVAAAKYLPGLLPDTLMGTLGSGPIMPIFVAGAASFLAYKVASNFDSAFGDAVLFGGLMQAGSIVLNTIAPPPFRQLALSGGLGDIVQTRGFVVPDRVMRAPMPPPPPSNGNGMGRFRRMGRRAY